MLYKNLFCRQGHFPDLNIKRKNSSSGLISRYLPFKKKISYKLLVFFTNAFNKSYYYYIRRLDCSSSSCMVHLYELSIVLLPCAHIQISHCFISPLFQAEYIERERRLEPSTSLLLYFLCICFL